MTQDVLNARVANQQTILRAVIDNVERGAYMFRHGTRVYKNWYDRTCSTTDYEECAVLLDEADREMIEPIAVDVKKTAKKRKKIFGII